MCMAFVCILNLLFKNTDRSDFVLTDWKLNIYEWIEFNSYELCKKKQTQTEMG